MGGPGVTGTDLHRHLGTILDRSAGGASGAREAIRCGDQVRDYTTLRENSVRIANGLLGQGLQRGDRVAVLLRNSVEWVELFFGLAHAGLTCVPVNVLLNPAEVVRLFEDADVRAFVLDQDGLPAFEAITEAPPLVVTVGDVRPDARGSKVVPYADLLTGSPSAAGLGARLDDPMVFYYTSGTTGLPKASVHTHNGVLWNSYHQIPDLRIGRDEVYLVVPSLSWAAGFNDVMLASLWAGGRSVLMPSGGVSVERVVDTVERNGVTSALIVPTLLKQLVRDEALQERLRRSSLKWVITGSEPVPLTVIQQLIDSMPDVALMQGYGLSEFPTVATMLMAEEAVPKVGTAGRPNSITRLAVMTDEGEIADTGAGEVLLRSPATMVGYWNRPDETAAAFEDGWLHTGDLGTVDDEGYLTITGRKKDMIISGGMNIYPSEIESVIYQAAGVIEASVVGVPDERWGEVPVAVVVAGEGFDEQGLADLCEAQLAGYKRPRRVLLRPEGLPKNAIGKILKRELQPWAAEQTANKAATTTGVPTL